MPKKDREEETKIDKSCQGVLGDLGPSVAETIHFHLSSVAQFIQMHTSGIPQSLFRALKHPL